MRLLSVAVPVPALGLLTYAVPEPATTPAVGARVVVPLGPRRLTGIVLGDAEPPEPSVEVREIVEVLDTSPYLPADVVATIYHCLGVPADLELRDRLNRPFQLVPWGNPIRDVLA